jgi:teichuronic acid biosynthesis glycosyltransferase TuaH
MRDIIFVAMENWDEVWRRNQFLCAGLAKRYPDIKILFVGLPRDFSHYLRCGQFREMRDAMRAQAWNVPGVPNVTVIQAVKLLPNTLPIGRRFNEALARAQIRQVAQSLGMKRPILFMNPQYAVHMVGRMDECAVIYDVTDDWSQITQSPAMTRLTLAQDAELCRRADAVTVCSQHLFDMKQGMAKDVYLIPNGADAEHYRRVLDGSGPLPDVAAHWPKPVLGYTGTVHPDRVDVRLIEALARRFPQGSIALVGPDMLPEEDRARLRACGNVHSTGAVSYHDLPEYMRAFDVCIVPHLVNSFTESLQPIKLWEYLAAGKPIVSTKVAYFRGYPQFVRLASDADEFARGVWDALQEDTSTHQERRRSEARRHSWEACIDVFEGVIDSCLARRQAAEGITGETLQVC